MLRGKLNKQDADRKARKLVPENLYPVLSGGDHERGEGGFVFFQGIVDFAGRGLRGAVRVVMKFRFWQRWKNVCRDGI